MSSPTDNPQRKDPAPLLAEALEPLTKPTVTTNLGGPVATAVQKYTDLARKAYEENNADENLEGFLWSAWQPIFDAAEKTPVDQQEGLVQFILELKKHDVTVKTKDSEGKEVEEVLEFEYDNKKHPIWKDLPTFGWEARERLHRVSAFAADSKEDRAQQNRLVWLFARLTGQVAKGINVECEVEVPGDFSLFGLWSCREVFEADQEGEGSKYIGADGELVQGANAELASRGIMQASLWINFAGEYLWRLSQANREVSENSGKPGTHFQASGWKGFNKERWAVWKRGFEKAQEWVVGEEAKEAVKMAVGVLGRLD
ncbi:hypothetical protein QBC40DRAFT_294131 [Triangularia verruculosa]|uniref:Uncharacterized protein n=1 Tax=Triangularia verruculosa TaxID=2587418 RepID=A0AAN7AVY0_9PEZI|nr:hypothetical protein QBC40DRAFT_294131 [Triangularia verruculosa]